ncbi:MAG: class I SAM-dependent methyltransferase [Planctomycetota bacterium]|nr:class I SAM-dependent methyltransferase [Planctomycetota bacterium]
MLHHLRRFGIRPGDKVFDVGCGSRPYAHATHLADIRVHRRKGFLTLLRGPRPTVCCSVEALPFRDNAFDFVYCSHVLEHVRDPAAACRELQRVAPRGYIECPRSWLEFPFCADDHRWLVDLEGGCLAFREKLDTERRDFVGIQYDIFDLMRSPAFLLHWNRAIVRKVRNVELLWSDSIPHVVIPRERRGGHRYADPRRKRSRKPEPPERERL